MEHRESSPTAEHKSTTAWGRSGGAARIMEREPDKEEKKNKRRRSPVNYGLMRAAAATGPPQDGEGGWWPPPWPGHAYHPGMMGWPHPMMGHHPHAGMPGMPPWHPSMGHPMMGWGPGVGAPVSVPKKKKKVADTDLERAGRCSNCGAVDHKVAQCPSAPPVRQRADGKQAQQQQPEEEGIEVCAGSEYVPSPPQISPQVRTSFFESLGDGARANYKKVKVSFSFISRPFHRCETVVVQAQA